ncbi:c-type cytochrome [Neisseria perflava]|uniref:c-type cytochrome n=1 Tax=Neisseria perflava TaxID=33053 RepID=UPI00209C8253|nr:c-type cytochrome [Neisseria perflava]MCP1660348.1 cytochrome c5 [Neisseria perflava]MCP1772349.1 cytochrome c5 [Neisseria perflava]
MKQLSNNKAQGSALFTLVSGIVILLAVVFFLIKLAGSSSFSDVAETTESATQTRIQPTGQLTLGDGTPVGERTGEQIFKKICIQCHAADSVVPNAPKFEHASDWAPRIAKGFDTLFQHALNGFNAMPAKGGAADLTDDELKRAIAFMANSAGGNFEAPAVGAAPAEGAASDAAASGATPAADNAAAPAAAAPATETAAAAPAAGKGKEVYDSLCMACHGAGVAGAPKTGDAADWKARITQGKDTVHKHAIEGFTGKTGMMPAKGGNTSLSDADVMAAVDYMVNQSGGKF